VDYLNVDNGGPVANGIAVEASSVAAVQANLVAGGATYMTKATPSGTVYW
jgi:hypothetical protein